MRCPDAIERGRSQRALASAAAVAICAALIGAAQTWAAAHDPDLVFTPRQTDIDEGLLLPFEGPNTPTGVAGYLAVDNSSTETHSRVYVTPAEPAAQRSPTARASELVQGGNLRIAVTGKITPRSLPRRRPAPVAITVAGKVSTTDGSDTPQLRRMRIEFNRHGRVHHVGLPTCPYKKIQPASTARALKACRAALVGQGRFFADIALAGQEPYPTQGRLLLFNGKRRGRHVLWGQIYSARPFATSFVIVFEMSKRRRGTFGTVITANLPEALGSWGRITGIRMQLRRRYRHRGRQRSYLSSACPAPKGFRAVSFPLARTSFEFAGGRRLRETLNRVCRVRGT